ncbi:MAG: LssY C-terminal domain-containing protein [Terriglobales bacterium]
MKSPVENGLGMRKTKKIAAAIAMAIFAAALLRVTLAAADAAHAQGTSASSHQSYTVEVNGSNQWTDTNIDLRAGEELQIAAEGTITLAKEKKFGPLAKERKFGPAGSRRILGALIHEYAVPNGTHGELIGRLGSGAAAKPFEVGAGATYTAPVAGRLFLGINENVKDAEGATGSFQVKIEVLNEGFRTADATTVGGPPEIAMPAITPKLLNSIPRRVSDKHNHPGDMVNILIVGTEEEMVKAFTTAEWVKVDKSVEGSFLSGLKDTVERKDYLTMPMSRLYLFDRPQDYGFAHAEPLKVFVSRNHLRAWESPYRVKGRPLWCVAATHDIGIERDKRNELVTHKIDPAIDDEREYVNQTLSGTGLVAARGHVLPAHPVTAAKTATGGEFHSDGRILVLVLKSGGAENR